MLPIWDTIKHAVLATATKIATMSLFWLEQMLPFCPKDIPDVDHKCCKKSRQKITFFHDIFMRKFSTPLHWSCCLLLLSNIVKIDLISSSHFFWPPLSKLIFYSILWLFLFTCQNPSENFGDHFSLSFHYEGRNWPFSKSVFWTIT